MIRRAILAAAGAAFLLPPGAPAAAENLYRNSGFPAMSTDRRAAVVGDVLTVIIFQAAESSNSQRNASARRTNVSGSLDVGSIDEDLALDFGGNYAGVGEIRRTERLVAQLTVTVEEVLPNGDFIVVGEQWLRVNGERTRIGVRGRVRQADISSENSVVSSRIADAQIDYEGRGFVSRSARPGLLNRIFSFLGLG
jgi:flagellar L-ring protein FlgH